MDFNGFLMSGETPVAKIKKGRVTALIPERLPLYLAGHDDLEGWLQTRAIDRHRPNSRILKKVLRLTETDDLHTVLRVHAATITDDYWLKPEDSPGLTYEQVRFTEDTFAELALTGSSDSFDRDVPDASRRRTPELTNIGSFEKCWRLVDGSWYLYKQGSPLERFSELFIARLCAALGFPHAEYEADGPYVRTKDFTQGRYNFEPAAAIVGDNEDYAYNYDRIAQLSPALLPQYLDLLFMDALCFNMDRHTYNYGFLRDRETGAVVSMAPNFDNNIALVSRGYFSSPVGTSNLLIGLFVDLLRERGLHYEVPELSADAVLDVAKSVLPGEDVDRSHVATLVLDRYRRLRDQILDLDLETSPPAIRQQAPQL